MRDQATYVLFYCRFMTVYLFECHEKWKFTICESNFKLTDVPTNSERITNDFVHEFREAKCTLQTHKHPSTNINIAFAVRTLSTMC